MDKCQFCDFTHTRARVLIHMIRNHEHESKFTLSCNFCGASYNKYDSFRKHLYRKHHQTDSEELLFDNDQVEPDIINLSREQQAVSFEEAISETENHCNSFILRLRSTHNVPQSAVDSIVCETRKILKSTIGVATAAFKQIRNDEHEPDNAIATAVISVLNQWDAFHKLDSKRLQDAAFVKKFHLLQPIEVKLGERYRAAVCNVQTIPCFGYIVPFLDNLKSFLQMPEVRNCLELELVRNRMDNGAMFDFDDGKYCKTHAVFSTFSLRVGIYTDDVEIVNPIGVATKKHKLTLFYWQLLNIPPILGLDPPCAAYSY
jgi:hypothetical protein